MREQDIIEKILYELTSALNYDNNNFEHGVAYKKAFWELTQLMESASGDRNTTNVNSYSQGNK